MQRTMVFGSVAWFKSDVGRGAYPKMMQPSSARRRACSQARTDKEPSIAGLPCAAVNQVLTTKLVLASS
jgi:hypothetical protein